MNDQPDTQMDDTQATQKNDRRVSQIDDDPATNKTNTIYWIIGAFAPVVLSAGAFYLYKVVQARFWPNADQTAV